MLVCYAGNTLNKPSEAPAKRTCFLFEMNAKCKTGATFLDQGGELDCLRDGWKEASPPLSSSKERADKHVSTETLLGVSYIYIYAHIKTLSYSLTGNHLPQMHAIHVVTVG